MRRRAAAVEDLASATTCGEPFLKAALIQRRVDLIRKGDGSDAEAAQIHSIETALIHSGSEPLWWNPRIRTHPPGRKVGRLSHPPGDLGWRSLDSHPSSEAGLCNSSVVEIEKRFLPGFYAVLALLGIAVNRLLARSSRRGLLLGRCRFVVSCR